MLGSYSLLELLGECEGGEEAEVIFVSAVLGERVVQLVRDQVKVLEGFRNSWL